MSRQVSASGATRCTVVVVAVGAGSGWIDAVNEAVESAQTPAVAIVDAGVVVERDALDRAASLLYHDRSVAMVAPERRHRGQVLGWRRLRFDGLPVGLVASDEVLFAEPDAFVVARDAFLAAGGLMAGYEPGGAAIELGWRLWLLGWRVVTAPGVVVDLPEQWSPASVRQGDALRTIFTHFDDERASVAVAAAGELDARSELLTERESLQRRRERPDVDILRLFQPFATYADGLEDRHRPAIEARWGSRHRIAVVTPDRVGARMAGPAIRASHIAEVLGARHDVRLVSTAGPRDEPAAVPAEVMDADGLRALERWADVLVVQGFLLRDFPFLRATRKVVVVDAYDPLHLEQLELTRAESDVDRCGATLVAGHVLNEQLALADLVLCASDKQRDFWLGQMAALGRVNPRTYDDDPLLARLLAVVPFGLPEDPPQRSASPVVRGVVPGIAADDDLVVWGGGVYNWFDPLTLIRAVDRLRQRRPRVRLYFMGMQRPGDTPTAMATEARGLADELGLTGMHVFFNEDWVPYDDRGRVLVEADVAVSTHLDHVETAFSFRTRILDYLWAGLPVVATGGDSFAALIDGEGLGATVDAGDVDALEGALFRLLDDDALRSECRAQVARVRERFTWPKVLAPLVEFCDAPRRAPDVVDPSIPIARPRDAEAEGAGAGAGGAHDRTIVRRLVAKGRTAAARIEASVRARRAGGIRPRR